ncbi:UNVERIFIED_CONTAM: hypothetical protein Q9R58_24575 [Methylobacteriaceae bacterium AG10]|nr:hypothetical protein [Methylobacteriaceae bacterium AG10]
MWGRYDLALMTPGALADRRDLPDAESHIFDAGHFAPDEKVDEISVLTACFLERHKD